MISTVRGRQNFSKASQDPGFKSDGLQTMAAPDRDRAIGQENVGDVLNKVADPNWVDPVKARKVGNNQLDKDAFMKLMLTQMKNQDPTTPLQSHEMAAQLAQFTSLEQLSNINTGIESLRTQGNPQTNYQALNFIGKQVAGDTARLTRAAGDKDHGFNFSLSGDAAKVKIKIYDGDGNEVRKLEYGNLKKGANAIKWNGLLDDGQPARPGQYKFAIEAVANNGSKLYAQTEFKGKITGLNYTPDGPVLLVGDQSIRMQDVKRIEEVGNKTPLPADVGAIPAGMIPPGMMAPGAMPSTAGKPGLPNIGPKTSSALSGGINGNQMAQAAMQNAQQSQGATTSSAMQGSVASPASQSMQQSAASLAQPGLVPSAQPTQVPPQMLPASQMMLPADMSKNISANSASVEQPNAGGIARNVPMERGMLDKFTKETQWNAKSADPEDFGEEGI